MRVALVIPTIDKLGGAERQVLLLAEGFAGRGHQVTVVALSGSGGASAAELTTNGVAFVSLGMRKGLADPRGWWRLHRWLRRNRPHVVHAHLPHAIWLARWSRCFAHIPVLVDTIHTSARGGRGRQFGYRLSKRLSDCVTAVSKSVAEAYLSAGLISESRCCVIPNGIDCGRWHLDPSMRGDLRREFGLGEEFVWLAAGRLEPVKDYPTLLRALALIPEPCRLLIAGIGPDEAFLRALARSLGLESRVRFLGFQPDLRGLMQAVDGFALSSRWEGLPMALLEAAASSLPIVATDVPGSWEVVTEGQTGLLVRPRDAHALAAAMTRIQQMPPQKRCLMGELARQSVRGRYELDRVLDRWATLFESLLKSKPADSFLVRWLTKVMD